MSARNVLNCIFSRAHLDASRGVAEMSRQSSTSGTIAPKRRAFSLAEALMATTVLCIVTASAALPFAAGVQQANAAARLEQATAYGQALMEEILGRPFFPPGNRTAAPGPDSGETDKTLFNNLDDFDGYNESATGMRDYSNLPVTDSSAAGLYRSASVQYISFTGQAASDTNSFVRIIVQVWDGNANLVTLTRIASRED
jgi:type II secretory pathway pseudopilin PulG